MQRRRPLGGCLQPAAPGIGRRLGALRAPPGCSWLLPPPCWPTAAWSAALPCVCLRLLRCSRVRRVGRC
eukprot:10874392-Lingulodinium_polyedra.AAC.1